MSKEEALKEFHIEHTMLLKQVDKALESVLLSDNRISKHKPWTWLDEPTDTHLLKAARHILTHLNIKAGGEKPSDENHLYNATTRLAMAIAKKPE
jgi:hypothetical protein